MKHTRKIISPTCVTSGFVDDGDTMGTPFSWHTGAPTSDKLAATSPSTAPTRSLLTSRVTALPASRCSPLSSYVITRTCFPLTPPALLISSTAICMPLSVERPNVASDPVIDAKWPITISPDLLLELQPADEHAKTRHDAVRTACPKRLHEPNFGAKRNSVITLSFVRGGLRIVPSQYIPRLCGASRRQCTPL